MGPGQPRAEIRGMGASGKALEKNVFRIPPGFGSTVRTRMFNQGRQKAGDENQKKKELVI